MNIVINQYLTAFYNDFIIIYKSIKSLWNAVKYWFITIFYSYWIIILWNTWKHWDILGTPPTLTDRIYIPRKGPGTLKMTMRLFYSSNNYLRSFINSSIDMPACFNIAFNNPFPISSCRGTVILLFCSLIKITWLTVWWSKL